MARIAIDDLAHSPFPLAHRTARDTRTTVCR
jgi:hypothetical protein